MRALENLRGIVQRRLSSALNKACWPIFVSLFQATASSGSESSYDLAHEASGGLGIYCRLAITVSEASKVIPSNTIYRCLGRADKMCLDSSFEAVAYGHEGKAERRRENYLRTSQRTLLY